MCINPPSHHSIWGEKGMNRNNWTMCRLFLLASTLIGMVMSKDRCETDMNVHGRSETNCSQRSLTAVPIDSIPKTTEILLLNFNNLKTISTSSLGGFPGLTELDLSNNDLSKLDTSQPLPLEELNLSNNSLTQLPNISNFKKLTKLFLAHNSIAVVPDDGFSGLDQLKEIDLQRNRIAFLSDQVFEDLQYLESLDLSYNELRNLPRHLLSKLQKLDKLYLAGNRLTELPDQFFEGLDALAFVYLDSNPWNCNCALEYFQTWVTENNFNIYIRNGTLTVPAPESVMCSSPLKLKGTPVAQFSTDHCRKIVDGSVLHVMEPTTDLPTTPETTTQPTTIITTTTERITAQTTVLTDPTTAIGTTTGSVTELTTAMAVTTKLLTETTTPIKTTLEIKTEPTTALPTTTRRITQTTTALQTTIQTQMPTITEAPPTTMKVMQPTTRVIISTERKVEPTSHYVTAERSVTTLFLLTLSTQTDPSYEKTTGIVASTSNISTLESIAVTTEFPSTMDVLSVIGKHEKQFGTLSDYIAKYCCFLHLLLYLISLLIMFLETVVLIAWMCWVYFKYYRPTKLYVQKPPNIWLVRYSLLNKEGPPPTVPIPMVGNSRPVLSSFKGASRHRPEEKRLSAPHAETELELMATNIREYSLSSL
ncbi:platelet glycoprotein Ib alpha chain isoform X2 [Ambystoma mexicanum]|uniref:platelet glycoprotein Ib alpha chain isoform X2 n=1 Tax=Ambystoma mexicanum TaxID=8296 RepID=UPI0037E7AE21